MSGTWSQGGQHSGPLQNNSGPFQGPPPICFKCGGEHYVVACPQQTGSNSTGPPAAAVLDNQQNGSYGPSGSFGQIPQWGSAQNGSAPTRFPNPRVPQVVTRYAVPGVNPQVANPPGPYGPSVAAPQYQQYPGSVPPSQSYPPLQPQLQPQYTPNNHPYGSPGVPQTYSQPPPQSYSDPLIGSSYINPGYQPPPQNQYPHHNGPPQFGAPIYQPPPQQSAPLPVGPPYQPSNSYPLQNAPHAGPSSDQNQASQWNSTTPASFYSASPFQQSNKPQFPTGIPREYSGTPRPQAVSQPTQTFQLTQQPVYGSERHETTRQTVASGPKSAHPTPELMNQNSPMNLSRRPSLMARSKSSNSSIASYARPASRPTSRSSNQHKGKLQLMTPSVKAAEVADASMEHVDVQYEDGELTQDDLKELEFEWELERIFLEQPPTENVCLAQPLSTTWDSTPVPLLDQRLNNSVSRYARKDNLKDFMKPIRSQPQWSYLQEDPAFSDPMLDELLVPLQEVPAWMAARHGIDLHTLRPSRKRARSEDEEEDEQEVVDNQIKLEAGPEHPSGNKRPRNEEFDLDTIIVQTSNSPTRRPGTPTLARAGSLSGLEDDVWAPQPGECASAPVDPTEALLASLGVSGSPKPVRKPAGPPLSIPSSGRNSPSFAGVPQSMSPQGEQNTVQYNMPSAHAPHVGPQQFNPPYGSSPNGPNQEGQIANSMSQQRNSPYGIPPQGPHQGQFLNGMPQQSNLPYVAQQHNVARQNSYGNGISPQADPHYTSQPYGMPTQNSFGSGISPQGNAPHGNQQYGMPRQNSYGNGIPQQQASSYVNHPSAMSQQHYPPQNQYGPRVSEQINAQYGTVIPAQANTPFGPQQNNTFPNPSYGMPTQQYSPQNQYNNGMSPQHNGSHPHANVSYSPPDFGNQANGMRQQGSHSLPSFNNNAHGCPPPRQDSGYVSARGSYSNGSGTNHSLPSMPPQHRNQKQQQQSAPQQPPAQNQVDVSDDTPAAAEPEETNFFASLPSQFPRKEKTQNPQVKLQQNKTEGTDSLENEQGESPLTPTSMEILGKLIPNNDPGGKKIKRPQPVVEAAYSRRW